jgi:hypothetical protein
MVSFDFMGAYNGANMEDLMQRLRKRKTPVLKWEPLHSHHPVVRFPAVFLGFAHGGF